MSPDVASTAPPEGGEAHTIRRWQLAFMGIWGLAAMTIGVGTYVVDDLQVCSTTAVETPAATETETSSVDQERVPRRQRPEVPADSVTTKVTERAGSEVLTTECGGLPLPALALLLLPAVGVLVPSLQSLGVAGLFNITMREVKDKLAEQTQQMAQVGREVADIRVAQQTLLAVGITQNFSITVDTTAARGEDVEKGEEELRNEKTVSFEDLLNRRK